MISLSLIPYIATLLALFISLFTSSALAANAADWRSRSIYQLVPHIQTSNTNDVRVADRRVLLCFFATLES